MSKKIIKIAIFLIITSFLTTCKKDFLYEKSPLLETDVTSIQSFIVVLPDEDAENCPLIYKNADNLKFKITQKPEWLILDSKEGKFVNDTAWIKCSAKKQAIFSKTAIYYDFMEIKDENGNKYTVELAYVTEGNPQIEVYENINITNYDHTNSFTNGKYYTQFFLINNKGDGILIWEIVKCPNWLYIAENYHPPLKLKKSGILFPYKECDELYYIFISDKKQENKTGQIIIKSNDKDNPLKIININVNVGETENDIQ